MTGRRNSPWTPEAIESLGVRTDLPTACDLVYGCGRTKAFELHRRGELDFPVLVVGRRVVVPTAPLKQLLGLAGPIPTTTAEGDHSNDATSAA